MWTACSKSRRYFWDICAMTRWPAKVTSSQMGVGKGGGALADIKSLRRGSPCAVRQLRDMYKHRHRDRGRTDRPRRTYVTLFRLSPDTPQTMEVYETARRPPHLLEDRSPTATTTTTTTTTTTITTTTTTRAPPPSASLRVSRRHSPIDQPRHRLRHHQHLPQSPPPPSVCQTVRNSSRPALHRRLTPIPGKSGVPRRRVSAAWGPVGV